MEVLRPPPLFFQEGEGVRAAHRSAEPILETETDSRIVTEQEKNSRASRPCSASSKYQALHQTLEALQQQMDKISVILAQSELRRKTASSSASIIAVEECRVTLPKCHFQYSKRRQRASSETIYKKHGGRVKILDTTTAGITDTLPVCPAGDNRLLESNPCKSDTKDEPITSSPTTSSMKAEKVPLIPNSCSATNFGTRILSANTV